ncbi:MAG: hypothetical protein Q9170_006723 [Blastenia crenularia]
MPLIIPGLNPTSTPSSNSQQDWMTKLMGKKITESGSSDNLSFAKQDLPKEHRVVGHDEMSSNDHKPERLTVSLGEDGIVRDVKFG